MGEHRAAHAVADGEHALDARAAILVDDDETALVELDSGIVSAQAVRVRPAPHRDDQLVDLDRVGPALVFIVHLDAILADLGATDLGAQPDVEPLLLEILRRDFRHFSIRHEQKIVQCFENRDLRAQP